MLCIAKRKRKCIYGFFFLFEDSSCRLDETSFVLLFCFCCILARIITVVLENTPHVLCCVARSIENITNTRRNTTTKKTRKRRGEEKKIIFNFFSLGDSSCRLDETPVLHLGWQTHIHRHTHYFIICCCSVCTPYYATLLLNCVSASGVAIDVTIAH